MKRTRTFLLLGLTSLLFTACHKDEIQGSGVISTEYRALPPFTSVQINGPIQATIRYAPVQRVAVRTDVMVLPLVRTNVIDNTLVLYVAEADYHDDFRFEVTVEVPFIGLLTQNGVGHASLGGFYDLGHLVVINNGVGDISLQGTTGHLEVTQHGVGRVNGQNMEADTCQVGLTGVGSVEVRVHDLLYGYLTGVGNIYYHGTPVVDVSDGGVGSVIRVD
ncbi:MAG: DUF2807 domain-containing protein [Flavobacteriales bacterium]|nr:DUF2807 domain-containing protein [Flavobacteriales bacterium]MBP9080503.1 DUF2807 domain-containing protein [Flavobacteriales bacterium]